MKIWIATGGTGGHVFPAMAVASELAAMGHRITISSDGRAWDMVKKELGRAARPLAADHDSARRACAPYQPRMAFVWASGVGAKSKIRQVASLFEIGVSAVALILRFMIFRPDRVVGFGGYSSVPAVLAARVWKIPTFSHEQNAAIGRAQKFTLRWVDTLMTSFPVVAGIEERKTKDEKRKTLPKFAGKPPTQKELKIVYTGLPVRKEFTDFGMSGGVGLSQTDPQATLGQSRPTKSGSDFRLLVTGGSLGATILDEVVPSSIILLPSSMKKKLFVVHQTRSENVEKLNRAYVKMGVRANVLHFIRDMAGEMRAADLVIGRSGASTVVELQTIGKPAILVPLGINPDQAANAAAFAKSGGGFNVPQPEFTAKWAAATVAELFENPARLKKMAAAAHVPNHAVENIVKVVTAQR
ncbi:MAG: UDP-N-acetylglucosamine--N-acetylmuramyl-(pentapeptide) pyrophosphoryl-undecaprenol N-acetylglucosamine transferase [Proteobacteria bacterium]|nr:UDP-N-acetylglucosamine--N-acetylmuramyl-(pentapeptide) pyrophosphoryl-undecaprenol N-acetylglucosamine transferase [Pseudomonadota bacterium]